MNRLAELTTLRLGGPAARLVVAPDESALIEAVRDCDSRNEPVLVLGSGSNLVVADAGFDGTVIQVATRGVHVDDAGCGPDDLAACGGLLVTAAAGENWDQLVERAVAEGWVGIEAISGVPGLVGATPMQNVSAYGQEVAATIWHVRTYDRASGRIRTFANGECAFAYRTSLFKGSDQYVVLSVTYQLVQGELSRPVRYAELARALGVELGERAKLAEVRDAVLALRRAKGMVLDPTDPDTWSAGSFFTNPILDAPAAARLPAAAPRWPLADGRVKTSAAWLIEHGGFDKGHPGPGGRVSLSTKHTLALTNRGTATTEDLIALARQVRDGVRDRYGVTLMPEPSLVGCSL